MRREHQALKDDDSRSGIDCLECGCERKSLLASCDTCGAPAEPLLTERERICLGYLDRLMEANAKMIGEIILREQTKNGGSNYAAVGAAVVGKLRKRSLVLYLPDLSAWRISRRGRAVLRNWINT